MLFTKIAIRKLQELVERSIKIDNDVELRLCFIDLINLLQIKSFEQVINYLKNQREQSYKRLVSLGKMVDDEYDAWKTAIKVLSDNASVLQSLDFFDEEQPLNRAAFTYHKEIGLKFAIKCILSSEIQWGETGYSIEYRLAGVGGDRSTWVPDSLNGAITKMLNFPIVVAWKKEHEFYQKISATLKDVLYINQHRMGIGQADVKRMTVAIQSVCSYLMLIVDQLLNLEFLPIETITFAWNAQATTLTVQVNDANPIFFEGVRAENLHKLFSNPTKYKIFLDDPKKNEKIRKDFDAMNKAFCAQYYQYGLVYGFNVLIHSDKYQHRLNSELAEVIKPMK